MTTGAHPPQQGDRTRRLPVAESAYDRLRTAQSSAKARLDALDADWPALLPDAFPWGDACFGVTEPSSKQPRGCRRSRLEQGCPVCPVAPAVVMPSMPGRLHDVDAALFWRRLPVPCWAIAEVVGRDPKSW